MQKKFSPKPRLATKRVSLLTNLSVDLKKAQNPFAKQSIMQLTWGSRA
jgi:hypothetical protein